jgi:quercetin dioxygenase-like cupin family protein
MELVKMHKTSCRNKQLQGPAYIYKISGRMKVRMDDDTEIEGGPGDTAVIPLGHDAWVIGNEPCVSIDFTGMKDFTKKT